MQLTTCSANRPEATAQIISTVGHQRIRWDDDNQDETWMWQHLRVSFFHSFLLHAVVSRSALILDPRNVRSLSSSLQAAEAFVQKSVKQRLSMSAGYSVLSTIFHVFVIAYKLFLSVISLKRKPHGVSASLRRYYICVKATDIISSTLI